MLIMTSIIQAGQSKFVPAQVDEDSNERIMNGIQTLGKSNSFDECFLFTKTHTRGMMKMLDEQQERQRFYFEP